MKLRIFEYAILLHPETNKKGEEAGKTEMLSAPKTILAKDDKQVGMLAAREIAAEHLDHLERVEVIVRPF
jgi:hypothetical protein